MGLDWNRISSLLLAVTYIVIALVVGNLGDVILLIGYLVIPLGCIWFSEEVGGFTGIGAHGISISSKSPGIIIAIGGWLLLFMPLIAAGISKLIPVVGQ